MSLRQKIKNLIYKDWDTIESVKAKEKLVDAILGVVREMVPPKSKKQLWIGELARGFYEGWNAYREELLERLEEGKI